MSKLWRAQNGYIAVCRFCKEQVGNSQSLCTTCRRQEQRKEKILEQLEIEKSFKERGLKVSKYLFGFDRKKLLEKYKIKQPA